DRFRCQTMIDSDAILHQTGETSINIIICGQIVTQNDHCYRLWQKLVMTGEPSVLPLILMD
ncbi:TPA: hypothetical protein ACIYO4_004664, partial [Escherichia coli]